MLKRWCIFFYNNFYVGLENPMENDLHAQSLPIDLSIVILLRLVRRTIRTSTSYLSLNCFMWSKILTNNATWLIDLYLNVKRKLSKFYIC